MSPKTLTRVASALLVTWIAWSLRARAVAMLPVDYDEDDYLRAAQEYAIGFREGQLDVLFTENYRPEHPPLSQILYGWILAPLPAIAVVALLAFLVGYTEFAIGWLFVESGENVTLAMAVSGLMRQGSYAWSKISALAIMMSLPVVLFFVFLRRYLLPGLLIGGIDS
jgi:hypothetical protein